MLKNVFQCTHANIYFLHAYTVSVMYVYLCVKVSKIDKFMGNSK